MTLAANHVFPAATSKIDLVPVIERGPVLDDGHSESVKVMRGLLVGLAIVAPFWAVLLGGIALATH